MAAACRNAEDDAANCTLAKTYGCVFYGWGGAFPVRAQLNLQGVVATGRSDESFSRSEKYKITIFNAII